MSPNVFFPFFLCFFQSFFPRHTHCPLWPQTNPFFSRIPFLLLNSQHFYKKQALFPWKNIHRSCFSAIDEVQYGFSIPQQYFRQLLLRNSPGGRQSIKTKERARKRNQIKTISTVLYSVQSTCTPHENKNRLCSKTCGCNNIVLKSRKIYSGTERSL